MAKFTEVIECLKNGGTAQRAAWDSFGNKEIMMQIPQCISKEIVPKMTSVQELVKGYVSTIGSGEIEYHHQVLIIDFVDDKNTPARATYYVPTWEDIMAEDWRLCQAPGSYKDRMKSEWAELGEKITKLRKFFDTQIFSELPENKQQLMMEQYDAMTLYSTKLGNRCTLEGIELP